jgi:hypothetical protein
MNINFEDINHTGSGGPTQKESNNTSESEIEPTVAITTESD